MPGVPSPSRCCVHCLVLVPLARARARVAGKRRSFSSLLLSKTLPLADANKPHTQTRTQNGQCIAAPRAAVDEVILDDVRAASLMQSEAFQAFFEKSSRIVERALNQPYDFAVDYSAGADDATYVGEPYRLYFLYCSRGGQIHCSRPFPVGFMRAPFYEGMRYQCDP